MAVQLALRRRKAGISRTSSSVELWIGGDRPYASRPGGAALGENSEAGVAGRPSGWRVVGRSGGCSNCDSGARRSVRPSIWRLSLRRLPASSVSAVDCVCGAASVLSMPVATTETRTTPARLSSKVAPTMMLASWSASGLCLYRGDAGRGARGRCSDAPLPAPVLPLGGGMNVSASPGVPPVHR